MSHEGRWPEKMATDGRQGDRVDISLHACSSHHLYNKGKDMMWNHGNLKGPPPNATPPQEIAGLIKGLLTTIVGPYFFGGVPLDCHDETSSWRSFDHG